MRFLRRTCREAAALMLSRQERDLPWVERLALRIHLAACDACPRFDAQVRFMQEAMRQWRHYSETEREG
ncbi:MAG TPA: zf-HC2 domain-containing protein [Methylibium sp.]